MKKLLYLFPLLALLALTGCTQDQPVTPAGQEQQQPGEPGDPGDPGDPGTPTPADPEPDSDISSEAGYRIFFIGNSFTKDAVEHLPGILNAAGINDVLLVHMFYGGRTVPEYNDGWDTVTDYHCYICNPGQTTWKDVSGKSLAHIAACAKWDVVTIQEHTGKQLAWGWTEDEKTALTGLKGKVETAQKNIGASPKLYYILSQAYFDLGRAQNVTRPFATTDQMWTVISTHAKTAVEQCAFDGVISTGAMFQNLRTSGYNNDIGLTRDGYHMDLGLARYGAACTVFESIIGPKKGKTMDGNSYRYDVTASDTTPVTDESAPVAILAARGAIAKPYEVTDLSAYGPKEPEPVDPDNITISTAADLVAFANRVNSGDASAVIANVTLSADIDCSSIADWIPIGKCTMPTWAHNNTATSGKLFQGSFDGGNHSIKNLKMVFNPTSKAGAYGFFGGIGKDGVVKNLVFDSSCSMQVVTSYSGAFGMLAGVLIDAKAENVKNYAPITGGGTSALANNAEEGRISLGGLIGWVVSATQEATTSNLYNAGQIGVSESTLFEKGGNGGFGVNGVMVGGCIGFSTNNGSQLYQTHTGAVNDGKIFADVGRTSGIIGASNRYTRIYNSTNNADIYNTISGNARIGNVTSLLGEGGVLDGCVNTGNLIAPNGSSVAGVVCVLNYKNAQVKNCSTIGATIVGKNANTSGTQNYTGVLFGQCTEKTVVFSNCSLSGKYGKTLSSVVDVTADNYLQLAGQNKDNCNPTITIENIHFANE